MIIISRFKIVSRSRRHHHGVHHHRLLPVSDAFKINSQHNFCMEIYLFLPQRYCTAFVWISSAERSYSELSTLAFMASVVGWVDLSNSMMAGWVMHVAHLNPNNAGNAGFLGRIRAPTQKASRARAPEDPKKAARKPGRKRKCNKTP